jgi:hypothetical protein
MAMIVPRFCWSFLERFPVAETILGVFARENA